MFCVSSLLPLNRKQIPSYQVRVGDLLYVQEHEEIRADMVLLQSSSAANGLAYIEVSFLAQSITIGNLNSNCIWNRLQLWMESGITRRNVLLDLADPK